MGLTTEDLLKVEQVVQRVVQASEDRVVARINKEVTDLAEVNHAVLNEISGPKGLSARVTRLEQAAGHKAY